jgi:hypothetical protein
MNIGWAVVWKRNGSVSRFVLRFVHQTGFRFAYLQQVSGKGYVLVYKRA